MVRVVLGVIAGYVSMALFIMLTFTAMWLVGGAAFAFRGTSLETTLGWSIGALVLSFVAAIIGGFVARAVAGPRSETALRALTVLIVVLGLALAIAHLTMTRPPAPKPVTQFSSSEAARYAVAPAWYDFLVPFVGAAGVLLARKKTQAGAAAAVA